MEIVNDRTHRVLAYIEALNRHGISPSQVHVDEFGKAPDRRQTSLSIAMSTGRWVQYHETYCDYLQRMRWIVQEADGVRLSPIGRALLKALNAPVLHDSAADVFEVVLDPENPFAYAQALDALSRPSRAMLVEPYFRLDQLVDIAELDNITRVLVGPNLKPPQYVSLANGLGSLPAERSLEIRKAVSLHDRYLIPDDGDDAGVLMLGISLGGIGKKVSTMTTLGPEASEALRQKYDAIWSDAEAIEPRSPGAQVEQHDRAVMS